LGFFEFFESTGTFEKSGVGKTEEITGKMWGLVVSGAKGVLTRNEGDGREPDTGEVGVSKVFTTGEVLVTGDGDVVEYIIGG